MARKIAIDQNVSAGSVETKERRPRTFWLDGHEWRPSGGGHFATKDSSKFFDRGGLVKSSQRQLDAKNLLDLGEHPNCQRRVSAEVEEILIETDGTNAELFLPDVRELFCRVVFRGGDLRRQQMVDGRGWVGLFSFHSSQPLGLPTTRGKNAARAANW